MSRSDITCGEQLSLLPATQDTSQLPEGEERRAQGELANARLGAFVVLLSAVIFYGGIAACNWYFR